MSDQVFLLPDLGEGLTEAEVVTWLVAVGDEVVIDQPIVEVETAKSMVEVPTPYAGVVAVLHGQAGETIRVDTPLITIASLGEPSATATTPASGSAAEDYRAEERAGSGNVLIGYGTLRSDGGGGRRRRPKENTTPRPSSAPVTSAPVTSSAVLVVSPLVRGLARDKGVDLTAVSGTGPGGLVVRDDVLAAATASSRQPAKLSTGERRTPISGFRKAVAENLARSRNEIPEATVWVDVDATELVALREKSRLPDDPGPGILTHLARFTVDALKAYPVLNGRVDTEAGEFVEFDRVNLGLAVESERGLVVPAVVGAEGMSTQELDEAIRDLTGRARVGRATADELSSGTFTLNNYGSLRVDGSAAIINHPQVGIVGFGRIIDRPWVVDGQIVVRRIMQMSLVFDHRVCDGKVSSGFIRHIADAIENPTASFARR